ncbi:MAG: hypothetical protein KF866_06840 [Phycisphaeraceae bacterium]|nr:hypothetical protein [Phycisphaeraceae bacterium]
MPIDPAFLDLLSERTGELAFDINPETLPQGAFIPYTHAAGPGLTLVGRRRLRKLLRGLPPDQSLDWFDLYSTYDGLNFFAILPPNPMITGLTILPHTTWRAATKMLKNFPAFQGNSPARGPWTVFAISGRLPRLLILYQGQDQPRGPRNGYIYTITPDRPDPHQHPTLAHGIGDMLTQFAEDPLLFLEKLEFDIPLPTPDGDTHPHAPIATRPLSR